MDTNDSQDIGDVERIERDFPDSMPVNASAVRAWLTEICVALAERDARIAVLERAAQRAG